MWEGAARIEAVFRRRALDLAKEAAADQASAGVPALVFTVAGETYALALGQLAEVAPFRGCTRVPGSPAEVLGVLNLRGDICPVIDLGRVLARRPATDTGEGAGFALILRARSPAGAPAVLKIDEAQGLREIRTEDLAPPAAGQFARPFVAQTGALLDAEAMLAALFPRKESRIL
jgi:chemotaxis signal transduction protein